MRIEAFGQRGYVLEKKASDYLRFRKKEAEVAYGWFEEAYQLQRQQNGAGAIVYMFKARYDMFKQASVRKKMLLNSTLN